MSDIKIFVSHRIDLESETIENPLFVNVRCGATYDKRKNVDMIGDDTGDNISEKREQYCEFTVQYWAWKNVEADYYGLCHYRRYFSFNDKKLPVDGGGHIGFQHIDEKSIKELELNQNKMKLVIEDSDIIISTPFKCSSVYKQYKSVEYLNIRDIEICREVINEEFPEYSYAFDKYMNGTEFYPCAMFIMKKELFFEYSSWLFRILFKLEEKIDFSNYGEEANRTIGHIGERLLGVFLTFIKEKNNYKIKFLQRAIFWRPEKLNYPKPLYSDGINLVLSSSDYFIPYATMTIESILKNASKQNKYQITFLYSNISKESKEMLKKIVSEYDNANITFFCIDRIIENYDFKANNHVSVETFYRLFVQKIFHKFNKILYVDCDMIVKDDVSKLFDIDMKDYCLAAVKDCDWISQYNGAVKAVKKYADNILKIKDPYEYFQAGILLFNLDKMNEFIDCDEILEFAASREFMYVDQDVLNSIFQGHVKFLDFSWNVMSACDGSRTSNIKKYAPVSIAKQYFESRKNPKVIHYAGYIKPWNFPESDFALDFWTYARNSNIYEILLSRMSADVSWRTTDIFLNHKKHMSSISSMGINAWLKNKVFSIVSLVLPKGTMRREKVKNVYFKLKYYKN